MNWVDLVVLGFVAAGLWQGFWHGFMRQVFHIVGLIIAIFLTLWLHPHVGGWIENQLHVPIMYARPVSLVILFAVVVFACNWAATFLHRLFAPMLQANRLNRAAGMVLGTVRELLFASFILALLSSSLIPASVRAAVERSRLGDPLIRFALWAERKAEQAVSGTPLKSLTYQMVASNVTTSDSLNYTVENPTVDEESELKLFAVANELRRKMNKPILLPNLKLREAAQSHARDMLKRGYFSHVSPDGKNMDARVRAVGLLPVAVGENLITASTIESAQMGLLAAPDSRNTTLSEQFNQVGIAVLDAGQHGKMVVQLFARL